MRNISLDDWIKEGHGFSADSYRNKKDDTLLLKLFYISNGEEFALDEYNRAIAVEKLGLPVPKVYEMVKVGDQTGIIYERILDKKSFGRLCSDDPENIPKYARYFAKYSNLLHHTKCDTSFFPRRKDAAKAIIEKNAGIIGEDIKAFMLKLVDDSKDCDTCLHNDLQPGNMVMGWCNGFEGREKAPDEENKVYFIDLGSFGYGDPLFDLAAIYLSMVEYKNEGSNIELLHMTPEMDDIFWPNYVAEYIGSDKPEDMAAFEHQVRPYCMFFIVAIVNCCDGDQGIINTAKRHLREIYNEYN